MLAEQYREAIFWFWPHTLERTLNKNHGELPKKVIDELAAAEVWLAATRPRLGEERPVRMATRLVGAQCVERVETVVHDRQWPSLGWWQLTAFPQAVAWLTQWVREAQRDIATLQAEWDEKRPALEERIGYLVQTYRRRVHRKKYLGDLPVTHERVISPGRSEYSRVSGPYFVPPVAREDQWYDPVEELDQTHADRRLELANELVQLPPFTAYCRTATSQHHVALHPPAPGDIDEQRIERIRLASKARFGRPAEPPEPPTAPPAPSPPSPGGPRSPIGRHPSGEEEP